VQVTPCDGTEASDYWCCGTSRECCANDSGLRKYRIAKRFGDAIPVEPSSSLSSSSIRSSATTSLSPMSIPTPTSAAPNPISQSTTEISGATSGIATVSIATSAAPTSTFQPTASTPDTAPGTRAGTLSAGAKVGIGVSAGIAALVLVSLVILVMKTVQPRSALRPLNTPSGPVSPLSDPKWTYETPVELVSEPHSPIELPDNELFAKRARN
jgi:hypothetical protein